MAEKRSIKEPIPEMFEAWEFLNVAVDAHLDNDRRGAEAFFKKADIRAVWEWLNPAWVRPDLNVVFSNPAEDSKPVPKHMRDPDRNIAPAVKAAVLQRDGYRCRYCGIPVVHSDIRKQAHRLYPDAVPWDSYDPAKEHAAFACLWLQFDHVVPHSHGGRSSVENVVVSCALCNYGKDKYTLKQLGVADPRLTPPTSAAWDGLERFRAQLPKVADGERARVSDAALSNASIDAVARIAPSQNLQSFFFPWSRFSRGYLYTPPIAGKERWFKIDGDLKCESASRQGVPGYVLTCNATVLRRRGIDPNVFVDPGE